MPAAITIPISTFEISIAYERPEIKFMADRVVPVQALFTALGPWGPELDDMEIISAGKLSEQGVKIRINSQNASFFFGTTGCKFTKDAANWAGADEMLRLLTTALGALNETSGVTFGKRTAIRSLHIQLKTASFKDILRTFMSPELLKLDPSPTEAMAIVARWPKHRITLDGSAALANGIFLQTEREFDASTTFEDMRTIIFEDEAKLLTLLGVEAVEECRTRPQCGFSAAELSTAYWRTNIAGLDRMARSGGDSSETFPARRSHRTRAFEGTRIVSPQSDYV